MSVDDMMGTEDLLDLEESIIHQISTSLDNPLMFEEYTSEMSEYNAGCFMDKKYLIAIYKANFDGSDEKSLVSKTKERLNSFFKNNKIFPPFSLSKKIGLFTFSNAQVYNGRIPNRLAKELESGPNAYFFFTAKYKATKA